METRWVRTALRTPQIATLLLVVRKRRLLTHLRKLPASRRRPSRLLQCAGVPPRRNRLSLRDESADVDRRDRARANSAFLGSSSSGRIGRLLWGRRHRAVALFGRLIVLHQLALELAESLFRSSDCLDMILQLVVRQLPGAHLACCVFRDRDDLLGFCDAARVHIDGVLQCPKGREDAVHEAWKSGRPEYPTQECEERIRDRFTAADRDEREVFGGLFGSALVVELKEPRFSVERKREHGRGDCGLQREILAEGLLTCAIRICCSQCGQRLCWIIIIAVCAGFP